MARQQSTPQMAAAPAQAKAAPTLSPRGPAVAGSPAVEASWTRTAAKPTSTSSAQPRTPSGPPADEATHPKIASNTNNSGMTLVPLAQAQAAQAQAVRPRPCLSQHLALLRGAPWTL